MPPLSGFFSKDQILAAAESGPRHNVFLFIIAAFVAMLTSFYMFRLWFVAFGGTPRSASADKARALSRFLLNAFYFDAIYGFLISITHEMLARLADWLDRWLIAGLGVRGIHGTVEILGRGLRLVQTGSLQTYAFLFAIGVA